MKIGSVDFVLTAFSPLMFGEGVTAHWKALSLDAARALIDEETKILSRRVCHEQLARAQFPELEKTVSRVELQPGSAALHLLYSGPPLGTDGRIPEGGFVRTYLLEVEEYQEAVA
ncbi:hypothetical protein EKJ_26370 [Qipengyuania flava]|uniref:DUF1874 domain-containing protein n=2 Tax=Qipengyuania flava TaxID=192812 RepID=A0A3T1CLI2_9SPHN|nr:hypothetical protein EKJ_26370 [Qipengyuania flava]